MLLPRDTSAAITDPYNWDTWYANDDVYAILIDGAKTYIGEYFDYVGPDNGMPDGVR